MQLQPSKNAALFAAIKQPETLNTHHSGREDVVEVFEECFLLDFLVRKDECHSFSSLSRCSVKVLQVLQQIGNIVRPKAKGTIIMLPVSLPPVRMIFLCYSS